MAGLPIIEVDVSVMDKATEIILRQRKELEFRRDQLNRIKPLATAESLIGAIVREEYKDGP